MHNNVIYERISTQQVRRLKLRFGSDVGVIERFLSVLFDNIAKHIMKMRSTCCFIVHCSLSLVLYDCCSDYDCYIFGLDIFYECDHKLTF